MQLEKLFENVLTKVVNRGGHRDESQGPLIVIGGPGGTGLSTIARFVAEKLNLHYVYSGGIMREFALQNGYEDIEKFLTSDIVRNAKGLFDMNVEREMIARSQEKDVLVDSKAFAAVSTLLKIPTSIKIWITADIDVRTHRVYEKYGLARYTDVLDKKSDEYVKTRESLISREKEDGIRLKTYYGIEYDKPDLYNDVIIDTSKLGVEESVEMIISKLKEKGVNLDAKAHVESENSNQVSLLDTDPVVMAATEFGVMDGVHPEDLEQRWTSWKCLVCNYTYEGRTALHKCPRCGNDNPDLFD